MQIKTKKNNIMRKITFLLALFASTYFVNASVYLDETFNYTDGTLKPNWTAAGTIGTWTGDFMVGGSALTYSNSGGTPYFSGVGKGMTCDYQSPYGATNYYLSKTFNASSVTSGIVYASFLYSPNGSLNTQSNAPLLYLTGNSSTSGVSVYVGKALSPNDAINFRFGTTRGSSTAADIKWSSTEYSMDTYKSTVFFIVLKYDITNQTSYLYINPIVGASTEPTADASDATSASPKTSLQVIEVKANGSTKTVYKMSSIRVTTTWDEAVAAQSTAPQLSAPAVGTASAINSTGFTANWSSVANASGYDVKVYLGTNLISTTNVSGQSTESLTITGLMSGISYTYKVIAKGDITNYSDSDPSSASTAFNTTDPYASDAINTDFSNSSWGDPVTSQPTTGSYPSSSVNGFDLNSAVLYSGTVRGIKGELHTNRIAIDKLASSGSVTLPTANSLKQIEIHATAGTAGNGFVLKEFNATTNTWDAIGGTYVYDANSKAAGTDSIYIIPVSRSVPTKFRIENPTNGGIYLMQIITRINNPALLSKPDIGASSGISQSSFTANWTAVANATGYKVYVYQAGSEITNSPFSVNGQSTESLAITDLTAETAYTFKVQAIGDNDLNYSDSFLSFEGTATTSTATGLENNTTNANLIVNGKFVTASQTGNFKIYNLQGARLVTANSVSTINTQLPSGLYIVTFTSGNELQIIKKISIK